MARKYASLFERLVANTELAIPGDETSCWLWKGSVSNTYPRFTVYREGKTVRRWAHRAMLEEYHDILFPHDEAGHACCFNRICINPQHLEVQTSAHNLAERRGYAPPRGGKSWIPVLYPRNAHIEQFIDIALDGFHQPTAECPF